MIEKYFYYKLYNIVFFKSNTIISDICITYLQVFQGGNIVLLGRYKLSQIQKTRTERKKEKTTGNNENFIL